MKTSSFNTRNYNNQEYYADPDHSKNSIKGGLSQRRNNMTMTMTVNKNKNNLSQSKMSNASSTNKLQNKTRFQDRIQKACDTFASQAMKKQVNLMKKQIQRLQKQSLKKDKRILQMQSAHSISKQLEAEIQQTYRLVYFYEGKISELQNQLKRLQKKIANNIDRTIQPEQVQNLLLQYRSDNGDLRGTIQEQSRIISQLQDHIKLLQTKYFSTSWKLSSQNRTLANPLRKKFPNLRQNIILKQMPLLQKQKIKLQMNQKFGQTQKKINDIQSQNQRLKNQLSISKTKASITMNNTNHFNNYNKNNANLDSLTSNSLNSINFNDGKYVQKIMSNSYTINSEMNNNNLKGLPPKSSNHYNNSNFYSTTTDTNTNNNKSGYYVSGGIDNNSNQRKYIQSPSSRQLSPRILQTEARRQSPRVIRIQDLSQISKSPMRSSQLSSYHRISNESQQQFNTPYNQKLKHSYLQ